VFHDPLADVRIRWTLDDVIAANDLLDAMSDGTAADQAEIQAEITARRTR
jgi:hypothetical protein